MFSKTVHYKDGHTILTCARGAPPGFLTQELRQRIKHLAYGHDRFVTSLKHETDAATAASADAARRRLDEDFAERASMKALNREQARVRAQLSLGLVYPLSTCDTVISLPEAALLHTDRPMFPAVGPVTSLSSSSWLHCYNTDLNNN